MAPCLGAVEEGAGAVWKLAHALYFQCAIGLGARVRVLELEAPTAGQGSAVFAAADELEGDLSMVL